jgi:hypothetical protein
LDIVIGIINLAGSIPSGTNDALLVQNVIHIANCALEAAVGNIPYPKNGRKFDKKLYRRHMSRDFFTEILDNKGCYISWLNSQQRLKGGKIHAYTAQPCVK